MRLLFVFLSRALILLVAIWLVRWLLRVLVGGEPGAGGPSATPRPIGELKKDPVCGTYVATELSVKTRRAIRNCTFARQSASRSTCAIIASRPPLEVDIDQSL